MAEIEKFSAFLSYAHHDNETDPELVDALTSELEKRVNAKLVNARLSIWRDDSLRVGNLWDERISSQIRAAHIFIPLLSPQWVQSDYCRKEFEAFEDIEKSLAIGDYVPEYIAPILIRSLGAQEQRLTAAQSDIYARIMKRQYFRISAVDFLSTDPARRKVLIDKIADDIEGMIERRRSLKDQVTPSPGPRRMPRTTNPVFEYKAYDYEKVDFVTNVEVLIDPAAKGQSRQVYAQVDFIERLYVQGTSAQIDFGICRAFLSIQNNGNGAISRMRSLRKENDPQNVEYVVLHDRPKAITLVMHPGEGRLALAELCLPPEKGENYLSAVAIASPDVQAAKIEAELIVWLKPDAISIAGQKGKRPSIATQNKIRAIMEVAIKKDETVRQSGKFRRPVVVAQRIEQ
jgi:hypothetical protein